ncbi:MAG: ShlB/FhaC/HecB family hemolysin secretion/activation protein [Opitutaceae bacterium]|nr:ShlB/FhaC/HecB family hemolysin secretion/activation protein [Opitutaceae bacterium]
MKTDLLTVSPAAWLCGAAFLMLLPVALRGQPLDRLQPAPVPPQVEAPPAEAVGPNPVGELSVPPTDEVLVDDFKGVAFFPTAEAAAATPVGQGLHFGGLTFLDTTVFRGVMASYLAEPITRTLLMQVTTATKVYLAQQGYPFSIVYLPEQDISDGVIRVVVMRSRLESEIKIEGARYFAERQYRDALRLRPDAPLAEQTLQADVGWINRNPFRAATIEARAGAESGTTQLVLRVRETRPWRFFVAANNTGTASTQEERVSTGVNWGNAFGLGHQLSVQWNSSDDFDALRSVSGSYVADLPWRHTLRVSGAYSRTNALVAPPFTLRGESWQVGLDYDVPLASSAPGFSHTLTFGVDFKASDNNFTFAAIPITDNLTHVAQARLSYGGGFSRPTSSTSFGLTLTGAPGGLTDRNEDRFFTLSRGGARAAYVYLRANATHSISLETIKPGLAWALRFQGQHSSDTLLGSEQMGGGGAYAVRGYAEDEAYGDHGVLFGQELRLPPWSKALGGARGTLRVQGFVFQDYARLWNVNPLPDEAAVNLHSAGAGLDLAVGRHASLRAAYGWQLRDTGGGESGRLHVAANVSF